MKKWGSLLACVLLAAFTAVGAAAGGVVRSVPNESNTVRIKKGDHTAAWISYEAESDPDSFYFGVSTDLNGCGFIGWFEDQDAYYYDFVVNPRVPATRAPVVAVRNPFIEDGEPLTDPDEVRVYMEKDGGLVDVTGEFSLVEEDGDWFFTTKTRSPGSYLVAQRPLGEEELKELAPKEQPVKKRGTAVRVKTVERPRA